MAWPRLGSPSNGDGHIDITFDAESRFIGSVLGLLRGRRRVAESPTGTETATWKAAAYLATLAEMYGTLAPAALAQTTPAVATLVLDPSALKALARGDGYARAHVARAIGMLARIEIPATALLDTRLMPVAEAVGSIVPIDEDITQIAGELLARVGVLMPLDALTVALGVREGSAALLTTDRPGISALARAAAHPGLHVLTIPSLP